MSVHIVGTKLTSIYRSDCLLRKSRIRQVVEGSIEAVLQAPVLQELQAPHS